MGETLPRYVTCDCQHCAGHIEFDADELVEENSVIQCPHCGAETKLFVPGPVSVAQEQHEEQPQDFAGNRHEGFFCGSAVPLDQGMDYAPVSPTIDPQAENINKIGKRDVDALIAKLIRECDQDMAMSFDDARRYVADRRFKLINPGTGERFTPETLEEYIQAKRLRNAESPVVAPEPRTPDIAFPPTRFSSGTRIALTTAQARSANGEELIAFLLDLVRDGFIPEDGVKKLLHWLEPRANSEINAVHFLLDIVRTASASGHLTKDNRFMVQLAVERVLPKQIRETISKKRLEIQSSLPAGERLLESIRQWGVVPPSNMTIAQAEKFLERLRNRATDNQKAYIKSLGGRFDPHITFDEASNMIQNLLSVTPATNPQCEFVRELARDVGVSVPAFISRKQAEELIPVLKQMRYEQAAKQEPPTPRQVMAVRFWNNLGLAHSSKWEVTKWLDSFYSENPKRKEAWEIFKREVGDDGSHSDPLAVPVGAGFEYLARV